MTPFKPWTQVLEEPWTCAWTMPMEFNKCALLIKVTNLQNHKKEKIIVDKS
jgi:hypothetical protein